MQSIAENRLDTLVLRGETARLLGKLYYMAGRQTTGAGAYRDLYEELRQSVITQGTRSSNGIEGIVVDEHRYLELMKNKVQPSARNEKLIVGYRDTLDYIHSEHERIEVTPETIKNLHLRIHAKTGDIAGQFRQEDNVIEREEAGVRTIVYKPSPWRLVESQVTELCRQYNRLHGSPDTDEFLLMAGFILDFTCIHPFMDGNGRVSRLLTTLLAYKAGFEVVRYISHERLVDETRPAYYYALTESSRNWQRGQHHWLPWLDYITHTFIEAHRELEARLAGAGQEKGYQSRRIREVITHELPTQFTIADILEKLPSASRPTINRVLGQMREAKEIETGRAGPRAFYRKLSVLDRR
ncbi:MAG TPA: Fic family protein [Oscillatoriaceae cyanobacterium]